MLKITGKLQAAQQLQDNCANKCDFRHPWHGGAYLHGPQCVQGFVRGHFDGSFRATTSTATIGWWIETSCDGCHWNEILYACARVAGGSAVDAETSAAEQLMRAIVIMSHGSRMTFDSGSLLHLMYS